MALLHEADIELIKNHVYKHDMVIVYYYSEHNPLCHEIDLCFKKFSEDPEYKQIVFIKADTKDNPLLKKIVSEAGNPFTSLYKKGFLLECSNLRTEKYLLTQLNRLKTEIKPMFR